MCGTVSGGVDGHVDLSVDPASLGYDERMRLLEAIEATSSRLAALRARTLAAVEAGDTTSKRWAREEAAVVMRVAAATATSHLKEAERLVTALPATMTALADGMLSAGQARALVEATWTLDASVITEVESRALAAVAAGHGGTTGLFRAVVRRAVATCDPRGVEAKHAAALADRHVSFRDQDNGMTDLHAHLPTDSAALLKATLDTATRAGRRLPDGTPDPRTSDQRRADTLIELVTQQHSTVTCSGSSGVGSGGVGGGDVASAGEDSDGNSDTSSGGNRGATGDSDTGNTGSSTGNAGSSNIGSSKPAGPQVHVTVAASTLLDLDELPGELAGHGAIPASMARALAADPTGTWRRILTDPRGAPLEVSPAYTPPPRMCRYVRARDRTCRFPNCSRRAVTCEIDHVRPWPDGPTTPDNLHPLCGRHHHLKHEAAGWHVHLLDDGTTRWHTPSGRTIDVPPSTYDDIPDQWQPPDQPDWDLIAPLGSFDPDAPPPPEVPPDVDDRWDTGDWDSGVNETEGNETDGDTENDAAEHDGTEHDGTEHDGTEHDAAEHRSA